MKYIKLFEKYKLNDNFNSWFGDSKIVDSKGSPLIVYHGTKKDFDIFSPKEHRVETEGYYFSANPTYSNTFMGYDTVKNDLYKSTKQYLNSDVPYGKIHPSIIPVYLSVQNPLILDSHNKIMIEDIGYWKHIYDSVKDDGYDGIMTSDMEQIFVFDPTQIKSAYGNNGNFDPTNKSILENIKKA